MTRERKKEQHRMREESVQGKRDIQTDQKKELECQKKSAPENCSVSDYTVLNVLVKHELYVQCSEKLVNQIYI